MNTQHEAPVRRGGFSLVEVNLAIMLIALGMLALFGIFPSALREGENARTDTHAALFADYVLSGIHGNAKTITNWSTWRNLNQFRGAALSGLTSDSGTPIVSSPTVSAAIDFSGSKMRYILEVGQANDAPMHPVRVWVWSGEYSVTYVPAFKSNTEFYCTEVNFQGAMP